MAMAAELGTTTGTCLIATTRERLLRHAADFRWAVERLDGTQSTSAIVVKKHGGIAELWVRRTYRRYRRLYERFLQQCFGGTGERLPLEWEVDHLQCLHRFNVEHPLYFVRVALLPRAINASYGAGFERLFFSQEREKPLYGGIHMDWLAFLKCQGIYLPGKGSGQERWQLWAWDVAGRIATMLGMSRVLCYGGISTVLNLGYTARFRPLPLHPTFRLSAVVDPGYGCYGCWPET